MAENFPELLKIYSQVQEAPNKVNERKPTSNLHVLNMFISTWHHLPTLSVIWVGLDSILFHPVWLFIGNASDYISPNSTAEVLAVTYLASVYAVLCKLEDKRDTWPSPCHSFLWWVWSWDTSVSRQWQKPDSVIQCLTGTGVVSPLAFETFGPLDTVFLC